MKYLLILLIFLIQFPAFSSLTFEDALKEVRARSTELPPTRAGIEAAEHLHLSKKFKFAPALSAGYSKSKELEVSSPSVNSLFLKASLNLFNGGSDYSDYRASSFNLFATKATLDKKILSVEKSATNAIFDYLQKELDQEIISSFKAGKINGLKTTKLRFKRGLTSKQEVLKAKVDLGIARARLKSAKVAVALSKASLVNLLGHHKIKVQWPYKNKFKKINQRKLLALILVNKYRPSLQEAKFKMLRDENSLKSAKRAFFPKVNFSYTMSKSTTSNFESDSQTSLLTVSMPIFSNWQTYSSIKNAQATALISKYNYKEQARLAASEWSYLKENLVDNIQTALERDITVRLSRSLYKDNFKRFNAGRASVNDLQIDQDRLLQAESQASSGWAQAHLAYLDFCHARGLSVTGCSF